MASNPFTGLVELIPSPWSKTLPERRQVIRDQSRRAVREVHTPEYIWVLAEQPGKTPIVAPYGSQPTMIRQEYQDLSAIPSLLHRRPSCAEEQQGARNATKIDSDQIKVEDDEEVDLTDSYELRVDKAQANLSDLVTYPNPFLLDEYAGLHKERGSIVISGLPGIGKTHFLNMIFHLRVAASLPTLYMENISGTTVYRDGHLGELRTLSTGTVRANITQDTWCLIDSSVGFDSVPNFLTTTKCLIIQASSPPSARLEWMKKRPGVPQCCLMKPWTIEELFSAYVLQLNARTNRWDEQRIQAFYEKFGGSARHTFEDMKDPAVFELDIELAAAALTPAQIKKHIHSSISSLAIPNDVTHMLLSAFPLHDEDRRLLQIRSPSAAMEMILLKRLDPEMEQARRKLYRICVGVQSPGCRATAARLLDQRYHSILLNGGCWPVSSFKKSATSKGKSATIGWVAMNDPSSFLLARNGITVVKDHIDPPFVSTPHMDLHTEQETSLHLETSVYYRPLRTTFPTFDSFYIDFPGHAIVFQTSVSKKHDMKEAGITWLRAHGIDKLTYVYVVPINTQTATIAVPVEHELTFDGMYLLPLPY
ncbi:hypothetical protein B0H15DRAFT_854479 [Mycena belliarum]|uniref:Uncharacterized protein n=1 Tax=Mycena belliarum TaxID=1033014 RepID=A0AAD6XMK1_9AGAR|nr:hypothetical protein B0H15DRAFT_854479 [Mycena belliae]